MDKILLLCLSLLAPFVIAIEDSDIDLSINNELSYELNDDLSSLIQDGIKRGNRKFPCQCSEGQCKCCSKVLSNANVNSNACVNISYVAENTEFQVRLIYDNKMVLQQRLPALNPRPLCIRFPQLPVLKLCFIFKDIHFVGRNIQACVTVEGRFLSYTLFSHDLDCFQVGANGFMVIRPQSGNGEPGSGQPGSGQPGSGQTGNGQTGSGQPGSGEPDSDEDKVYNSSD